MTISYVQPLPTIAELEGRLKSEKFTYAQLKVIEGELKALRGLDQILSCFPSTKDDVRRRGYSLRFCSGFVGDDGYDALGQPISWGTPDIAIKDKHDERKPTLSDIVIEVRGLSTSDERLKEQHSRLYLFVTEAEGRGLCASCDAYSLLLQLKTELGVPLIACFSSLEGIEGELEGVTRGPQYAPFIAIKRKDGSLQNLAEMSFDQIVAGHKR